MRLQKLLKLNLSCWLVRNFKFRLCIIINWMIRKYENYKNLMVSSFDFIRQNYDVLLILILTPLFFLSWPRSTHFILVRQAIISIFFEKILNPSAALALKTKIYFCFVFLGCLDQSCCLLLNFWYIFYRIFVEVMQCLSWNIH